MSGPLIAFTQPSGGMGETGSGGGGTGDVVGPVSAVDREIAVFDGVTGKLLARGVATLSPAGVVAGVTQLNVDNVRIDGNAILSTNTNGDISLTPNGSGTVVVPNGSVAMPGLRFVDDGTIKTGFFGNSTHWAIFASGGVSRIAFDGNSGHLGLTANGQIRASAGADPATSHDVCMVRDSPGVWVDSNLAGQVGKRLCGRVVEASTTGVGAPNLLSVFESRKLLTNEGATAEAYNTLPTAAAGLEYVFYCHDTDGIRIVASAGDTIRIGASVSAAAGFVRSVVAGSVLHLVAINAVEWVSIASSGTWTIDS